jgi:hypothetical protein
VPPTIKVGMTAVIMSSFVKKSVLTSVNDETAEDERPIDESACYNDDGSFNDERF